MLGLDEIIKRACEVDRAGVAILECLLFFLDQELSIMGVQNAREMIIITTWYLWWEWRKLFYEEKL